jgi:hypothetical protein
MRYLLLLAVVLTGCGDNYESPAYTCVEGQQLLCNVDGGYGTVTCIDGWSTTECVPIEDK